MADDEEDEVVRPAVVCFLEDDDEDVAFFCEDLLTAAVEDDAVDFLDFFDRPPDEVAVETCDDRS